ncbi:MAG: phosphomannose isomerase type II C-terminal cupin domain [Candidatus Caldatribacterium sp.]|nr:phosphomannose isomerase type II C-terminal cupin domain [Candidatus Caldatribacterium sp.]
MLETTLSRSTQYKGRHTREPCIEETQKPWGRFIRYTLNEPTTVKILEVNPGASLSLQSHTHRDELWVLLAGKATVELDGKVRELEELEPFFIPRGAKHRLRAHNTKVRVLEISFGYFDEEDIIRFEDDYGRAKNL